MRLYLFLFLLVLTSCSVIRQNPKYSFADGRYTSKVFDRNGNKVYVDYEEEDIHVYPLRKTASGYAVDTTVQKPVIFGDTKPDGVPATLWFRQNSFDIDFLTIPFKYRFPVQDIPRQFNTALNGAVYLGYRSDIYVMNYSRNLIGRSSRNLTHIGFSVGAFSGLGGTAINPSATRDQVQIDYEGVVWSKGLAGLLGWNNFTMGLALGWDHLLDRNRTYWLYQQKPWLGFVVGLNLN